MKKRKDREIEISEYGIKVILSEEDYLTLEEHHEIDTLINHIGNCDRNELSGSLGIMTGALSKEEYAEYEDDEFVEGKSEIQTMVDWQIEEISYEQIL